jgi:monoterpene epsilon-lactone hydrolase
MPSWQARILDLAIRGFVRRRDWGDERALARRARFVFGALPAYSWLAARGLRWERVDDGGAHGEWLTPERPLPGVILYVHGGGFVSCSAATHRPISAALARFTNRRVFSVDYRLAPEHRLPAANTDVLAAYQWLLDTGVASSDIALAGDSAGGNLVLGLAIRLRDELRPAPACLVAFSPWTDLAGRGSSVHANDGRCAMFRTENIAQFAAAALGEASADRPAASPVYADLHGLPPVLLHVGSTEILLDDSRRMHEQIRAAGGSSRLEIYGDVPHGWQMLVGLVPEATASLRDAAKFIAEHVGRTK